MNKIIERNEITFESIKHIDENGFEYWLARELMLTLEYKRWDKFNNVINNAKIACKKSNYIIEDHFSQVGKMIELAKDVHYEVGKKVRKAIADIGGMMPEEMPTPKKSLKELEREKKQLENIEMKKDKSKVGVKNE